MASKYARLGDYLRAQGQSTIPMTFVEIECVVGVKLPKSQKHQAWWSNSTSNNVMTQVWLDAGYRTEQVDTAARKLVFRRVEGVQTSRTKEGKPGQGMSHVSQQFQPAEQGAKKPRRSPLFGALKGLVTIEPGWDITKPALDPEELAEWEASLDRKADLYEKGLTRKP